MTWNIGEIQRTQGTPRMAGWLGKVAAGILGLAGATSCLLQVLSPYFQMSFNEGLVSYNYQCEVKERDKFKRDQSSLGPLFLPNRKSVPMISNEIFLLISRLL